MKHKIIPILLSLFVYKVNLVQAQNIYQLDLDKCLEIAKEQSYSMLMLKQNLKVAEHNLTAAKNRFRTNVDLDLTAPRYVEDISQDHDTAGNIYYFPERKLHYSTDLSVNQPLPTDGNVAIKSSLYNIDDFNNENSSLEFNTQLSFEQPIEAFYAYNNIKAGLERAELNYELSYKSLKRAELDLAYNISQAFYRMLSAKERKEIAWQDLKRQQNAYEIAKNKFDAGLIREAEALQMEIDLGASHNSYDIASVNFESQSYYLKQQLGLSLQDSINLISDYIFRDIIVDPEKAVSYGIENRTEIREHEIEIELSNLDIKRIKSQKMINGEIAASYNLIGVGRSPLNTQFGDAFYQTYQDMANRSGNFGVALNINIPIIDWGVNKSLVKAAQANQQREKYALDLEMVNIEREIRNTVNQLHSALRRLKLLEKNVEVAEKNFNISNSRFTNGDIDAQELALDRQRLNNAYISHLEAYISYKLLVADLARKTFYDWENDKPYSYQVKNGQDPSM